MSDHLSELRALLNTFREAAAAVSGGKIICVNAAAGLLGLNEGASEYALPAELAGLEPGSELSTAVCGRTMTVRAAEVFGARVYTFTAPGDEMLQERIQARQTELLSRVTLVNIGLKAMADRLEELGDAGADAAYSSVMRGLACITRIFTSEQYIQSSPGLCPADEVTVIDGAEICAGACSAAAELRPGGVDVRYMGGGEVYFCVSREVFSRLVENLIAFGVSVTAPGGRIELAAARVDSGAELRLRRVGPARSQPAPEVYDDGALSLAVVKTAAAECGGSVETGGEEFACRVFIPERPVMRLRSGAINTVGAGTGLKTQLAFWLGDGDFERRLLD